MPIARIWHPVDCFNQSETHLARLRSIGQSDCLNLSANLRLNALASDLSSRFSDQFCKVVDRRRFCSSIARSEHLIDSVDQSETRQIRFRSIGQIYCLNLSANRTLTAIDSDLSTDFIHQKRQIIDSRRWRTGTGG